MRWFGGSLDKLADKQDMDNFWSTLSPGVKEFYKIYPAGHLTFLLGIDTSPWMKDVLSALGSPSGSESNLQVEEVS